MSSVGNLKLIHPYSGQKMLPPMCDAENCILRARGYYADESGLGFDLCADHIKIHVPAEAATA